jgi:hypothetical protein
LKGILELQQRSMCQSPDFGLFYLGFNPGISVFFLRDSIPRFRPSFFGIQSRDFGLFSSGFNPEISAFFLRDSIPGFESCNPELRIPNLAKICVGIAQIVSILAKITNSSGYPLHFANDNTLNKS